MPIVSIQNRSYNAFSMIWSDIFLHIFLSFSCFRVSINSTGRGRDSGDCTVFRMENESGDSEIFY